MKREEAILVAENFLRKKNVPHGKLIRVSFFSKEEWEKYRKFLTDFNSNEKFVFRDEWNIIFEDTKDQLQRRDGVISINGHTDIGVTVDDETGKTNFIMQL